MGSRNSVISISILLLSTSATLSGCNTPAAPTPVAEPSVALPSAPPPTPPAAPPSVPPSAPAAGACSLQGQWSGRINPGPTPFSNSPVTADYRADHTIAWGTNMARFTGTWQVAGDTFAVTDTSCTIPTAACPSNEIGHYRMEWSPACDVVTFRLTDDVCDGRRPALSDLRLTRSP